MKTKIKDRPVRRSVAGGPAGRIYMNELSIFENPQFGKIRTLSQDGEPWFIAKDVCDALGLGNSNDAVSKLDEEEKGTEKVDTLGGKQTMVTVNESGLYTLIIRSNMPAAKPFRKWVTSEVIPSIRKHGAYMTPEAIEKVLADPDTIIQLATRLKEHQAEIAAKNRYISVLEPKAEFYDAVAGSKDAISISDAAKVLGIHNVGQNKLFQILRDRKILDRDNKPYQEYIDRGYFRTVEQKFSKHGETNIYIKTLVYQRGLDYIRKIVESKVAS